jgi:hypothetical protein
MRDGIQVAEAAGMKVGEKARHEAAVRLDQRDIDRAGGVLLHIARDCRASRSTADDDQLWFRLPDHGRRKQRCTKYAERGTRELREIASCQIIHRSFLVVEL